MQWFRNLFGNKAARPAPTRPSVRPQLEALEERQLLNASTVWDSAGNKTTFVVYANAGGNTAAGGVAYRYGPNGASIIGTGVKLVHGYKDQNGNVGFDIVYANGYAAEFDSTARRQIGNGSNVMDASHAFDANGNSKFDVLYLDGKGQGTGNLFETTNKGGSMVASNVVFATAFVDAQGVLSNAYGFFDVAQGVIRDFVVDSTGTRQLTVGVTIGAFDNTRLPAIGGISDYDQVTDPSGRAVIDLTNPAFSLTGGGFLAGSTIETSASGSASFGDGTNINPF